MFVFTKNIFQYIENCMGIIKTCSCLLYTSILFEAIRKLKQSGVGIIYISHRMSELDAVADRVTVLRDGQYIDTIDMENATPVSYTHLDVYKRQFIGERSRNSFPSIHWGICSFCRTQPLVLLGAVWTNKGCIVR